MAQRSTSAWRKALSAGHDKKLEPWRAVRVGLLQEAFSKNMNVEDACIHAGIHKDTYYQWIKRYPKLSDEFNRARLNPVMVASETYMSALKIDARLALDFLRMKRPDDYVSAKTKVELSGSLEGVADPKATAVVTTAIYQALKTLNEEANQEKI